MKRFLGALVVLGAVSLLSTDAHANLLTNGGFEDTSVTDPGLVNGNTYSAMAGAGGSSSWDVWTEIEGWYTPSADQAGIEVQTLNTIKGDGPINPFGGSSYYVELDSDNDYSDMSGPSGTNSAMTQAVSLTKGSYDLSFQYSPRTNNDAADDNGIAAYFSGIDPAGATPLDLGTSIGEISGPPPAVGEWTLAKFRFEITTADTYYISLSAFGLENELGGFVDDVSLVRVPEPGSMTLFAMMGLAGLGVRRRRR